MKVTESIIFRTKDGAVHLIDRSGNHFIDGRCVSPLKGGGQIGDSYPDIGEVVDQDRQRYMSVIKR